MTADAHWCCCPPPDLAEEDLDPLEDAQKPLVIQTGAPWPNHTTLHYYFMWGSNGYKNAVRQGWQTWADVGIGLTFKEVFTPEEAQIRIGFERDPRGSWSVVGQEALSRTGRTMNISIDPRSPGGRISVLHEIGHALGLRHEHQNPTSGLEWDEEAVYTHYEAMGWSRSAIYKFVLRKFLPSEVFGSAWDPGSIMHYWFPAGLITKPAYYQDHPLTPPGVLSAQDKATVRTVYPPMAEQDPDIEALDTSTNILENDVMIDYTTAYFYHQQGDRHFPATVNAQPVLANHAYSDEVTVGSSGRLYAVTHSFWQVATYDFWLQMFVDGHWVDIPETYPWTQYAPGARPPAPHNGTGQDYARPAGPTWAVSFQLVHLPAGTKVRAITTHLESTAPNAVDAAWGATIVTDG